MAYHKAQFLGHSYSLYMIFVKLFSTQKCITLQMAQTFYTHINLDLVRQWFRANRILLNGDKTEIIIFQLKGKDITKNLNFRISGQKICISKQVKYLGFMLDESLTWSSHISMLKAKPCRVNGLLA